MNDLAEKRGVSVNEITPVPVETHFFSEESPLFQESNLIFESGKSPFEITVFQGYILTLDFKGKTVTNHGSGDRVIQESN